MMKKQKKVEEFGQVPLESSLGHLAYGDIAFKAWRTVKKKHNSTTEDDKK